jgi:sulfide:quinone oxidoreductase
MLLTPERSPLEMFGETVSGCVAALLAERGVEVLTSAVSDVTSNRIVVAHPSGRVVEADRIVALPELRGPHIPGLPADGGGFLPVDRFGRVRGTERVWAAGDVTDFPIKQGGVAAGLADVVAQDIAALAGVPLTVDPFTPALRAVLLTGGRPRYLYGSATGSAGEIEEASFRVTPRDGVQDKVFARYLTPHLHELRPADLGAER